MLSSPRRNSVLKWLKLFSHWSHCYRCLDKKKQSLEKIKRQQKLTPVTDLFVQPTAISLLHQLQATYPSDLLQYAPPCTVFFFSSLKLQCLQLTEFNVHTLILRESTSLSSCFSQLLRLTSFERRPKSWYKVQS